MIGLAAHSASNSPAAMSAVPASRSFHGIAGSPMFAWLVDRFDLAVLLVDAETRLLFANRAAEELLQAGQVLRLRNGIVEVACRSENRAFRDAIATCLRRVGDGIEQGDTALPIILGRGPAPLSGCVAALPADLCGIGQGKAVASLFLVDPQGWHRPSMTQLQACFGLTPAEAALALEILVGDGLQACAGRLGISQTTARTHLGHVFEKTGTRRQAELVRLLLGTRLPLRLAPLR
ncbi:helix-turn-helix transcriptional regulator [Azospirillum sp. B21]|uniref:helix-turn-helix transcriptional regulator n=1 Tax=Azospirillum sp. B21 TaxID=2607496 RepID=UPI0011EEB48E|nr:helix-turn-helix transcriptional regulator [Azospirillum sp. B21]KAA0573520.1 helix-turn-helix transcriptional regulator [Azospirillum sp. B21]